MSETCHWCGADKHPVQNFCFQCFATDEFQSDKCRIRELEQQLAAVIAERDKLVSALNEIAEIARCRRDTPGTWGARLKDIQEAAIKAAKKEKP